MFNIKLNTKLSPVNCKSGKPLKNLILENQSEFQNNQTFLIHFNSIRHQNLIQNAHLQEIGALPWTTLPLHYMTEQHYQELQG